MLAGIVPIPGLLGYIDELVADLDIILVITVNRVRRPELHPGTGENPAARRYDASSRAFLEVDGGSPPRPLHARSRESRTFVAGNAVFGPPTRAGAALKRGAATRRQRRWWQCSRQSQVSGSLVLAARLLGREVLGPTARSFQALRLDGTVRVGRLPWQFILLNVWATWCSPCRGDAVHGTAAAALRGQRLSCVAVSVETRAVVRQFARLDLTFGILHDPTGAIQRIYRTTGVPESWVLDRSGMITKKVVGAMEWDSPTNVALVQALLDAR
jgi:hypothetical protein